MNKPLFHKIVPASLLLAALTAAGLDGWAQQARNVERIPAYKLRPAVAAPKAAPAPKPADKTQGFVVVQGTVLDAGTGKPFAGAGVAFKNMTATLTNAEGKFTLKVPGYDVAITISAQGYQATDVYLQGKPEVKARLFEESYVSLQQGVQTPVGSSTLVRVPYAVSSVQVNGSWNLPGETADNFLQGRVAGLSAVRRSGTPGSGANLLLRGLTSLNAGTQPLVVVDGVIYDHNDYGSSLIGGQYTNPLNNIDIKDIDNITVLKDATSLYGTKGANGVILVTTARARELATKIDFAAYGGVNFAPKGLELQDATAYRLQLSKLLQSRGMGAQQIAALPYMNDDVNSGEYYRYHNNTNWQDQVLRNSSTNNYYLKITGGDNIAKYALSMGYLKSGGVISNTDLARYSTRFNGDLNLSKRLTATTNLSFTFTEQNQKDQGTAAAVNPLLAALVKSPLLRIYEVAANGTESPDLAGKDIFNMSNPVSLIRNAPATNRGYRFMGAIGFQYSLTPALSLASTIGVTIDKIRENYFFPSKGIYQDSLTTAAVTNRSGGQVKRLFQLFNDTRLQYRKVYRNLHDLNFALGMRFQQTKMEQDRGLSYNAATDDLKNVSFGLPALRRVSGALEDWRWLNQYFSASYTYADKYFLSLNTAIDGSSRFGTYSSGFVIRKDGINYAVMPSLSTAWLLSGERFMKQLPFVSTAKLRASYSYAGNDDIGNFSTRQYYVSQNLLGMQGLVRGNFGNNELQWEAVRRFNGGLDLSLFKDRFSLSIDGYKVHNSSLLMNELFTAASGLGVATTNTGTMHTTGFEASANLRVTNKPGFKWDLSGNAGTYQTKLTGNPAGATLTNVEDAAYMSAAGSVPNVFWGLRTNGVYATDAIAQQEGLALVTTTGTVVPFKGGDVRYVDINGDKIIDANDRQDIGNPNAKLFGGFGTQLEYKRWSFNALATFSYGNKLYNMVRRSLESQSGFANQLATTAQAWTATGDLTSMPKGTWGDPMGNSLFSDRWIEDGSYLRLRTVSLAYNLPIKAGIIKYAVVYANGNNLLTLTRYTGFDPEFSAANSPFAQGMDAAQQPQYRSTQVGVRIGL